MSTEVARRGTTALARPSFIKEGDTRGTENIGTQDIKPPALRIAQSTSPETKRSKPDRYIDGLREGELFNSITKEIYGEGPIKLMVVNQLGHRHVEFDKDGKVVDFNVKDGDPRTDFTEQVIDGVATRVKPKATKFYDYLVLAITDDGEKERRELMTMSLKSTQLRKAKELNTLLKGSKLPSFAHLFDVKPVPEGAGDRSWYGWQFVAAGWPTEEQYQVASDFYDSMQGKNIEVETEDGESKKDDDIPF